MLRRLRRIGGWVPVVLPAAVLVLWVRSHLANDWLRYARASDAGPDKWFYRVEFVTRRGTVSLNTSRRAYENNEVVAARLAREAGLRWDLFQEVRPWQPAGAWSRMLTRWQRLGFDYERTTQSFLGDPRYGWLTVTAPYWSLTLVAALPLLVRTARVLHRRRRAAAGLCRNCGYDLRASGDRCPECGQAVGRPAGQITGNTNGLPPAPDATPSIVTP
jgi:hypothetical protein